ncbi:MAG: flagellar motor protein MotB, partial [Flavobacterium sp.]
MKSKFFLIPTIIFFSCSCFSQKKTDMGTANKLYKNDVFIDAVQIYKRVVEKGYHSMDIYEKLGNSYYFMGDFCEANKWYAKLFEYKRNMNYINYYRYSKVLMACGDKDKSAEISEAYTSKVDSLVRKTYAQIDEQYLLKIKTELRRYKLKTLPGINSTRSDYGVAFSGSKLVFASSRQKKLDEDYKKNFSKWTDESFFDLYYIEAKDKDLTIAPIKFSKGLDAVENKSTPAFTKDGNTMYFTGNDRLVDEISKERGAFLKIYKAEFIGGDWGNIVEVPFDNSAYNVAHPALSADEKVLYFASDMPGGLGDSDIYSVQIEGNNKFGKPVNLGPSVNTKGRESFPSVGPNGDLYFASNGRPGFGGLDIFVFPLDKKDKNTNIYNLGKPVNTRFDDFSITINPDNKSGFMSSNRNGGEGSDDILSFENTIELDFDKNKGFFNGLVVNSSNSIPLPNAKMSM